MKKSSISSLLNKYLAPNPQPELQLPPAVVEENFENLSEDSDNHENQEEIMLPSDNLDLQPDVQPVSTDLNYEFGNLNYWSNTHFPWSDRLLGCLIQYFGFDDFRPIQKAVMNATLSKHDVFLCIPTSSGKSLTFQLPALLNRGVTVVFMPLIALMQDQTIQLQAKGILVINLSGQAGLAAQRKFPSLLAQYREALNNTEGEVNYPRIIFLSPEKIAMSEATFKFLSEIYQLGLIERFVVDEAHCVSMWGHEFRQEYLNLKRLKVEFPGVPTLAMTATATEDYRHDIITQLGMTNVLYFQSSFNRENLVFEVRAKDRKNDISQIAQFINTNYPGQCGIVYTTCRNEAERVSRELSEYSIRTAFYHAQMCDKMRKDTQNSWMNGTVQVIVATIAFGMGINKPDVRFVLHYNLSKSLAHYYQEAGRAGRDGARSHCIIFYDPEDRIILEFFIAMSQSTPEVKKENAWDLFNMVKYCEDVYNCRRVISLSYFGEEFDKANCNSLCDNCNKNRRATMRDLTVQAQKIVQFILQLRHRRCKMEELPKMLLGIGKKFAHRKVLDNSLDKQEVAAVIKEMIVRRYCYLEYIAVQKRNRNSYHAYIHIDEAKVQPLLDGRERLIIHFPTYSYNKMKKENGYVRERGQNPNRNTQSQRNQRNEERKDGGSNQDSIDESSNEDNDNDDNDNDDNDNRRNGQKFCFIKACK